MRDSPPEQSFADYFRGSLERAFAQAHAQRWRGGVMTATVRIFPATPKDRAELAEDLAGGAKNMNGAKLNWTIARGIHELAGIHNVPGWPRSAENIDLNFEFFEDPQAVGIETKITVPEIED